MITLIDRRVKFLSERLILSCHILIVGLREVDSGKTTIASAVIDLLNQAGCAPCGFKPKAGNMLWYDYDIVYEALSSGRLYGKDSVKLKRASGTGLPLEAISPIHRLHGIPSDSRPLKLTGPNGFVMDRISLWNGEQVQILVLNDNYHLDKGTESLRGKILSKSEKVIHVENVEQINRVVRRYYSRAIRSAHDLVDSRHDSIVYESYSDIALPWEGIRDLDSVFLARPGSVEVYDPDRYLTAVKMQGSMTGETTTRGVRGLLEPSMSLRIPPFRSSEVPGKIKMAIAPLVAEC